MIASLLTTP